MAYDVVLLDANMPVLDGPSAARRIREIEKANGLRSRGNCGRVWI